MTITAAVAELRAGRLLIIPTDTVYGIAADPRVPGALERIYAAKQRDRDKPVPFLAADLDAIKAYGAAIDPIGERLAAAFWPGPLTLILPCGAGTEGFRVPAHAVTLALLRAAGGLLRVTSANISGARDALTADDAIAALGNHCAAALDAGPSPGGVPSTVIRIDNGAISIIREGVISGNSLRKAAGHAS